MKLTILNLKETLFEGEVASITLPAEQGELTILPNHVPIITALKKGAINASPLDSARGKENYIECSGGILEFADNKATVLL